MANYATSTVAKNFMSIAPLQNRCMLNLMQTVGRSTDPVSSIFFKASLVHLVTIAL